MTPEKFNKISCKYAYQYFGLKQQNSKYKKAIICRKVQKSEFSGKMNNYKSFPKFFQEILIRV